LKRMQNLKTAFFTVMMTGLFSASCLAATFDDVPHGHWAYAAVRELGEAKLIQGYNDAEFRGDQEITRYEMAVLVGKAIDNFQTADENQQKSIDRLSAEFASELNHMGVRVAKVEAKTKTWIASGDLRFRLHGNDPQQSVNQSSKLKGGDEYDWRARVLITGELNDSMKANIRLTSGWSNRPGNTDGIGSTTYIDVATLTAQNVMGLDVLKIGRDSNCETGFGLMSKPDSTDGIWIKKSLSKVAGFNAWTGNPTKGNTTPSGNQSDSNQVTIGNLTWQANDKLKFTTGYYWADIPGTSNAAVNAGSRLLAANGAKYDSSQGYDLGASYKFSGLTLLTEYIGTTLENPTNMNKNPNGWSVQLSNAKGPSGSKCLFNNTPMTDVRKKGDNAWLVNYRQVKSGAVPYGLGGFDVLANADTTGNYDVSLHGTDNVKGWAFAYEYVPAKNVALNLCYQLLSVTDRSLTPAFHGNSLDKTLCFTANCFF